MDPGPTSSRSCTCVVDLVFSGRSLRLHIVTFDQGGYFRPEYLHQGALDLESMTKEGQSYAIRVIGAIQLDSLVLLTSQLAAGISVEADKTGNSDEYSVSLFLQYFFQPRDGLFATDF